MTTLAGVAERLAQGEKLQAGDAEIVMVSHDLVTIGVIADEIRRQRHGRETTFVRVFEAHVDAVPATLPVNTTAGEFRLIGRPETVEIAVTAAAAMRRLAGTAPVFGYSLADLEELGTTDVYAQLSATGLDGIAEVPIDLLTDPGPVRAARTAGLLVLRLTVKSPVLEMVITPPEFTVVVHGTVLVPFSVPPRVNVPPEPTLIAPDAPLLPPPTIASRREKFSI